jgi:pSer/pThr/pTyr-binding forkhead associated (FHA) protein
MLLGAALGAALLIAENVWGLRGRWWRDLNWVPLGSALLGALGAVIGQLVYGLLPDSPTARAWGWAILGAATGAMLGLADRSRAKAGRGAFGGFAGGLAGGLVFDVLSRFLTFGGGDTGIIARVLGLAVLGFAVGLMVQVVQQALKTAWLSGITTGLYEGKQYILGKPIVTVGRSDGNDIGLYREKTLGLKAGAFSFNAGRWAYSGEALEINGSSSTNAILSSGDTIKLGETEFMFEDKGSPRAEAPLEHPEPRTPVGASTPAPIPVPVQIPVGPTHWKLNGDPMLEITSPAKLMLGRAADNNLVIDDANVSSHHATLEATNDAIKITDLGSTNGTKLNGITLEANNPVGAKAGDTLEFGDRRFNVERA